MQNLLGFLILSFLPNTVFAAAGNGEPHKAAIAMFLAFISLTLAITYWAAKHTKDANSFYAAGGGITGFQNGLAISGDYMSAASFLGISGLVFTSGYDGLIYSIGFLVGWPVIMLLIAEPLRNLGRYTFSDVVSFRLQQTKVRTLAALGSLTTVLFYLIAQIVGAGKLIEVLFGLPYEFAVVIVGVLMILYVTLGGMLATTWVQITKAMFLLSGATIIAVLVMLNFNFDLDLLFATAVANHEKGIDIIAPGTLLSDPVSAISLGLALMFGTAGLPHILMRFFTVNDAVQARRSVAFATGFIGYFYILTFIIGFGAITLLNDNYFTADGKLLGGTNMAAVQLAHALGGDLLLGFISAIAFATILAVVAGLTLAGASAISHDIYANVLMRGNGKEKHEMLVSKIATIALGIITILLGIIFEEQNVAFLVGLAFAIAASTNFPILLLSMHWRKLTTKGALVGGYAGLITAVSLVVLGPIVWVDVLGNEVAIFPYKYPALFSMPIAFLGIYIFSILDNSKAAHEERTKFDAQMVRSQTGLGINTAVKH